MNPVVSIIVPTFNRAHLIGETLDSIIEQTYTNWECIVVDDGSTDDTEIIVMDYVNKDVRFQFYKRPQKYKSGGNGARNFGFKVSKGKYINWFDSDDIMMANKIEKQLIQLSNEYDFVVCQSLVFDDVKKRIIGLRSLKVHSDDFFNDFILNKVKFLTQSPLFKRDFLEKNNLRFDEDLKRYQERDFFIKVLSIVDDYIYTDEPLLMLRRHVNSISYSVVDRDKIISSFTVNYRILNVFKSKLNDESIKFISQEIVKDVKLMSSIDLFYSLKMCFKLKNKIINFSFFKIIIGVFFMFFLNKGEKFFNTTEK